MGQWHNTRTNDVIDVPDQLDQKYKDSAEWEPHKASTEDDGKLKGKALDEALQAAGLPLTGTADEKRAALDEHNRN